MSTKDLSLLSTAAVDKESGVEYVLTHQISSVRLVWSDHMHVCELLSFCFGCKANSLGERFIYSKSHVEAICGHKIMHL